MTAALKPYTEMKESGSEWIGQVPVHWEVTRLKDWVDVNQIVLNEDTNPEYAFDYVDIGSVGTGRLTADPQRIRFGNAPSRARRVVRSGDTIISTVRTYLKAIWHAEGVGNDVVASTGFAVLTPRQGTVPKFVSYYCQSEPFTNRVTADSIGVAYPAICESKLGTLEVPTPPATEQAAIIDFLDEAVRGIERYIGAKQELITLLGEQKRALVHEVVTGQIDVRTGRRYPAYKSSGSEWLQETPAHWEMRRSKRAFRPRTELAKPEDIQLSATQAFGVIAQEDFENRVGRKVVRISRHLEQRRHVKIDDFVISMRSFQGGLERAWVSGCIRSSYIVLRPVTTLDIGYFGYLFKSAGYISALQATANFIRDGQDLNFDNFCRVDVPFPPRWRTEGDRGCSG